jgi:hypothetical protein
VKQPEKFIGKIYFDSFSPPLVHHEYAGKIIRTEKHENFAHSGQTDQRFHGKLPTRSG